MVAVVAVGVYSSQVDYKVLYSGLAPEDRVVVGDLWRATAGSKVTPQPTTIDALAGSAASGSSQ